MKNSNRSLIFKLNEVNVVDIATSDVVADNYIQMASDIIFPEGRAGDRAVDEVFEPQQLSGLKIGEDWRKDRAGPRFTL